MNEVRDFETRTIGINLWGVSTISGLNNLVDLTPYALGISHIKITDWYEALLRGLA